ncbi:alginate export family protein [Novosphingobium sp. HII-3]|uniref:alginate export family protein n=1 Tax=Novosphingobium sp. HII-3 TaxID=2075565 RepID=UPI000CDABF70|nr:alginate export family protein [Novosphingobium sp. HII-3]
MLNIMAYALSAAAAQAPATVPAASPERPSATTDASARGEIVAPAPASSNRTEAPQPSFKPINHDEDYSSFRTVRDTNLWTRLKYIPIAGKTYATLGGELRLRPEIRIGERWGRGPQDDNGNFQQRTRVWGDLHVEGVLRAFVDLEHATSSGLDSVVAPVEEGRLDFNQAFVEASVPAGSAVITARLGRQEVGIGNYTVFDMREGANTRRSLDVLRVMGKVGKWDGGFLTGHALLEKLGTFDDETNHAYDVTAFHAGRNFGEGDRTGRAEALFVTSDRASIAFDSAPAARDQRRTLSAHYVGKAGAWGLDVEGIRQWGSFGELDIDAYYVTGTVSHSWKQGWKPKLALRVDVGSGDRNPNDGKLGTYGPLFPRPLTYNGDLGPQNCVFRKVPDSDSGKSRTVISESPGQAFR